MSTIPEQVLARQKAAIDTMVATQTALFGGFEKLVDLNVRVIKATFDELSQNAQQASSVKDPQEAVNLASAAFQPNAEKAVAYSRHIYDILASVQGELARLQEQQVALTQQQMADVVDQMTKNAPAGSESAIAMLKSSLATANGAYDSMSKAAKQAADVAESNLNAATNATFQAATDAAEAANRTASRSRRAS